MTTIQAGFFGNYVAFCGRCGRGLTNPISVGRGIGPICWRTINGNGGNGNMNQVLNFDAMPQIPGAISQEYHYEGIGQCDCVCGLQRGRNPQTGQDFIILTELPGNTGTSVTNWVEALATQVMQRFGLNPAKTIIIEHYPERGDHVLFEETWDLVQPNWVNGVAKCPQDRHMWKHLTEQEAFALIGLDSLTNAPADAESKKEEA